MTVMLIVDLLGTTVFAISGALAAAERKLDLLGVSVIAFVTALGGGTVRDILIGSHPVGWMQNRNLLFAVGAGVLLAFLLNKQLLRLRKTMFLFDAIGLGMFSIAGLEKALSFGIDPFYAVICGMISATMGGVIRDVLCNEIPLIFRREIYATAGLIGAVVYLLLLKLGMNQDFSTILTVLIVITIRILAVVKNIGLPKIRTERYI